MDRRFFSKFVTALEAVGRTAKAQAQPAAEPTQDSVEAQHQDAKRRYAALLGGDKLTIGMVLYPG